MEHAFLHCPAAVGIAVEDPFGLELELPLSVPLKAAEAPDDILLWRDAGLNLVGLFHQRQRVAWPRDSIRLANVAVLHPDEGPGVVGVEVGLNEDEEAPVLATRLYSEEAAAWLERCREPFQRFFGIAVGWADYGKDR